MEVPIAMIPLSRILNRKYNLTLNLIASPISILWVIVPSIVMSGGNSPLSYIFFASIETMAMLFIIWYCSRWKKESTNNV
jgi:lipopolysaccharide export LptBFGC system permease protein LptF